MSDVAAPLVTCRPDWRAAGGRIPWSILFPGQVAPQRFRAMGRDADSARMVTTAIDAVRPMSPAQQRCWACAFANLALVCGLAPAFRPLDGATRALVMTSAALPPGMDGISYSAGGLAMAAVREGLGEPVPGNRAWYTHFHETGHVCGFDHAKNAAGWWKSLTMMYGDSFKNTIGDETSGVWMAWFGSEDERAANLINPWPRSV